MAELTMTIPAAAKRTGIGKNRLYELAKAGKIPALRVGHRYIVPREKFEAWLNEQAASHTEIPNL